MAAYKGQSRKIKDALVTILSGIEYEKTAGNLEDAFVSVKGYAFGEFDGFPAVRILPGQVDKERGSMSQDDRSVAFVVRVHVEREQDTSEEHDINHVYDLTDLIMNRLDGADFHNTLEQVDPTIGTYMLECQRGEWSEVTSSVGALLMCDVDVSVSYSKDLESELD